jgi:hypothetical protein
MILNETQNITFPGLDTLHRRPESIIGEPTPARTALLRKLGFEVDTEREGGAVMGKKGWALYGKGGFEYHENLHYMLYEIRQRDEAGYDMILGDFLDIIRSGLGGLYKKLGTWLEGRKYKFNPETLIDGEINEEFIIAIQDIVNNKSLRKGFITSVFGDYVEPRLERWVLLKVKRILKALIFMAKTYYYDSRGKVQSSYTTSEVLEKFFNM